VGIGCFRKSTNHLVHAEETENNPHQDSRRQNRPSLYGLCYFPVLGSHIPVSAEPVPVALAGRRSPSDILDHRMTCVSFLDVALQEYNKSSET
jgi:hypothetical protein